MTVSRMTAILRYHYEGTDLDQSRRYRRMSPHAMATRPICAKYTDFSTVTQLRGWLPDAIGGVVWTSQSRPCSSAYVPFYASVTKLPLAWRSPRAFAVFRAVCRHLDRVKTGSGNTYRRYLPLVARAYGALERAELRGQPALERAARRLHGAARVRLLTGASARSARKALAAALSLGARTR